MQYIRKDEVVKLLQKFIDSRTCNCSKQTIIERRAFEYALSIVNKVDVYETDKDIQRAKMG